MFKFCPSDSNQNQLRFPIVSALKIRTDLAKAYDDFADLIKYCANIDKEGKPKLIEQIKALREQIENLEKCLKGHEGRYFYIQYGLGERRNIVNVKKILVQFTNLRRTLRNLKEFSESNKELEVLKTEKKNTEKLFNSLLPEPEKLSDDLQQELNREWSIIVREYEFLKTKVQQLAEKPLPSLSGLSNTQALACRIQTSARPTQTKIFQDTDPEETALELKNNLCEHLKTLEKSYRELICGQDLENIRKINDEIKQCLANTELVRSCLMQHYKEYLGRNGRLELETDTLLVDVAKTLWMFHKLKESLDKLCDQESIKSGQLITTVENQIEDAVVGYINLLSKYGKLPYNQYQELSRKWQAVRIRYALLAHASETPELPNLASLTLDAIPFYITYSRGMVDELINSPITKRLKFSTQQTGSLKVVDDNPHILILAPMIFAQGNSPTIEEVKALCRQYSVELNDLCVINCVEDSEMEQTGSAKPATKEDWRKKGFNDVRRLNIANRTFLMSCGYNIGDQELFKPFTVSDLWEHAERINGSPSLVYCYAGKSRSVTIVAAAMFKRCWDNDIQFLGSGDTKIQFCSISSAIKYLCVLRPEIKSANKTIEEFSAAGQSLTLLLFCWRIIHKNLKKIEGWLSQKDFIRDVEITLQKLIAPSPVEKQLLALPESLGDIENFITVLNKFSGNDIKQMLHNVGLQDQNCCHFFTKLFDIVETSKQSNMVLQILIRSFSFLILFSNPQNVCNTLKSMYQAVQGDELLFAIRLAHMYLGLSSNVPFKERQFFKNEIISQINTDEVGKIIYGIFNQAIMPQEEGWKDCNYPPYLYFSINRLINNGIIFINSLIEEAICTFTRDFKEIIPESDVQNVSEQVKKILYYLKQEFDNKRINYQQMYIMFITEILFSYGNKLENDNQYDSLHRAVVVCIKMAFPNNDKFEYETKNQLLIKLLYFQLSEECSIGITGRLLKLSDASIIESVFKQATKSLTAEKISDKDGNNNKFEKELECKLSAARKLPYYQDIEKHFVRIIRTLLKLLSNKNVRDQDVQKKIAYIQRDISNIQISKFHYIHIIIARISEIEDNGIPLDLATKQKIIYLITNSIVTTKSHITKELLTCLPNQESLSILKRQLFQNTVSSVNEGLANGDKVDDQQLKLLQALIEKGNYEKSDADQLFENLVVDISEHPPACEAKQELTKMLFKKVPHGKVIENGLFVTQAQLSMNEVKNENAWSAIFYCLYKSVMFVRQIAENNGILSTNAEQMLENYIKKTATKKSKFFSEQGTKESLSLLRTELIASIIRIINLTTIYLFKIQHDEINHRDVNVAISSDNYCYFKDICNFLHHFLTNFVENAPKFFSCALIQEAWSEKDNDFKFNPFTIPKEVFGAFSRIVQYLNMAREKEISAIVSEISQCYLSALELFRQAHTNYLQVIKSNDSMAFFLQEIRFFAFEVFKPYFEGNVTAIIMYANTDYQERKRREKGSHKKGNLQIVNEELTLLNLLLLAHDNSMLTKPISSGRSCKSSATNKQLQLKKPKKSEKEGSEEDEFKTAEFLKNFLSCFLSSNYQQFNPFYLSCFFSIFLTIYQSYYKRILDDLQNKIADFISFVLEIFQGPEQYCAAYLANKICQDQSLKNTITRILNSKGELVINEYSNLIQELETIIHEIVKLNLDLKLKINQQIYNLYNHIRNPQNQLEIFDQIKPKDNYSCEMLREKFVRLSDYIFKLKKNNSENLNNLKKIHDCQKQLEDLKAQFGYLDTKYSSLKKRVFEIRRNVIQYQHYIFCKLWDNNNDLDTIKTKLREVTEQMRISTGQETLGTSADLSSDLGRNVPTYIRRVKMLTLDIPSPEFKDFLNKCIGMEENDPLITDMLNTLYMVMSDKVLPRNYLELYLKILVSIPILLGEEIKNGLKKFFTDKFIEVTKRSSASQDKSTTLQDMSIGVLRDILNDTINQSEKLKMLLMHADSNCVEYYIATLPDDQKESTILSALDIVNGLVPDKNMPIIKDWSAKGYINIDIFARVVSCKYFNDFTQYCKKELDTANSKFTKEINQLINDKLDKKLDENSRFLLEILKEINREIKDYKTKKVFFKKLIANWTLLIPNCGNDLNELDKKVNEQTDALEQNTSSDDYILPEGLQNKLCQLKLHPHVVVYFTVITLIINSQTSNILQIESLKDLGLPDLDLNNTQDKFSNLIARIISNDEIPIRTRYNVCTSIIETRVTNKEGILGIVESHKSLQGSQASTQERLKSIIRDMVKAAFPPPQSPIKSPKKIISDISNSLSPTKKVKTVKRIKDADVKLKELEALYSIADPNDKLAINIASLINKQKTFSSEAKEKIINCLYDLINSHALEGLQLHQLYRTIQLSMDELFKASSPLYMSTQLTLKIIAEFLLTKSRDDFDSISVLLCGIEFCCGDFENRSYSIFSFFAKKLQELMSKDITRCLLPYALLVCLKNLENFENVDKNKNSIKMYFEMIRNEKLARLFNHLGVNSTSTEIYILKQGSLQNFKLLSADEKTKLDSAKQLVLIFKKIKNDNANSQEDLNKWIEDATKNSNHENTEYIYHNIFIQLNKFYLITYKLILKLHDFFSNSTIKSHDFMASIYWAKADVEASRRKFKTQSEEDQYRNDLQKKCANKKQLIELVKQEFIDRASPVITLGNIERAFEFLREYQAILKNCYLEDAVAHMMIKELINTTVSDEKTRIEKAIRVAQNYLSTLIEHKLAVDFPQIIARLVKQMEMKETIKETIGIIKNELIKQYSFEELLQNAVNTWTSLISNVKGINEDFNHNSLDTRFLLRIYINSNEDGNQDRRQSKQIRQMREEKHDKINDLQTMFENVLPKINKQTRNAIILLLGDSKQGLEFQLNDAIKSLFAKFDIVGSIEQGMCYINVYDIENGTSIEYLGSFQFNGRNQNRAVIRDEEFQYQYQYNGDFKAIFHLTRSEDETLSIVLQNFECQTRMKNEEIKFCLPKFPVIPTSTPPLHSSPPNETQLKPSTEVGDNENSNDHHLAAQQSLQSVPPSDARRNTIQNIIKDFFKRSPRGSLEKVLIEALKSFSLNDSETQLKSAACKYGFSAENFQRVPGDGSCLYHAVLDQVDSYREFNENNTVIFDVAGLRGKVASYVTENINCFRSVLEQRGDPNLAINAIFENGWGEHLEIFIISKIYNANVVILNSDHTLPIVWKRSENLSRTICLGYVVNHHYWSIRRPNGQLPQQVQKLLNQTDLIQDNSPSFFQESTSSSQASLAAQMGIYAGNGQESYQKELMVSNTPRP
ncbi:MAG: hypothetical protein AMJ43_06055 [Coxiella sp. DG_40]|nr:MAG: hypothetical protein AMJ43_06055 [Coxiella sp. DG_40]